MGFRDSGDSVTLRRFIRRGHGDSTVWRLPLAAFAHGEREGGDAWARRRDGGIVEANDGVLALLLVVDVEVHVRQIELQRRGFAVAVELGVGAWHGLRGGHAV